MDSERARAIITRRLHPGETLIWHDKPSPWRAAAQPLLFLVFATIWTGFAVVWTRVASGMAVVSLASPPDALLLIGGLFCVAGATVWVFILRNVVNCWRTAYGLTNRRVIIAVGENGPTRSFGPLALSRIERSGGEERGTVRFDYGPMMLWRGNYGFQAGFHRIRAPARVEALIYEHLLSGSSRAETGRVRLNQ